jgi:acetyl esterase
MTTDTPLEPMDPELLELTLRGLNATGSLPEIPGPAREGQSPDDWLAEVARQRSVHDAMALNGAVATDLLTADMEQVWEIRDVALTVGDGSNITLRCYLPQQSGPLAAIAVLHGGAWWMGGGACGLVLNDRLCRTLCARLGAIVVNVDYRLAPEHAFPASLDDARAAVTWLVSGDHGLAVDPARVGVLGMSSGGNLAAALAIELRDDPAAPVRLAFQALLNPAVDIAGAVEMAERLGDLSGSARALVHMYVPPGIDLTEPRLSPLRAPDLGGVAPAVVVTGRFDPLREGGMAYVKRLEEAGVDVTLFDLHMTHTLATPAVRESSAAELVAALQRLLDAAAD